MEHIKILLVFILFLIVFGIAMFIFAPSMTTFTNFLGQISPAFE